jgi:hypothetical protein
MERWKTVQAEIEDFRRYLAPDFPQMTVAEGYDLTLGWGVPYKEARKRGLFNACGVYVFYDEAGTLLYVGKALWTFDKRIWTHKIDGARYIDLICFDDRHAPFALALEHFLICRLKPSWNKHGVGYDVPKRAVESTATEGGL